jgi:hypothetical protein
MRVSIDQESPRIIRVELTGRMDAKQWRASLDEVAKLLQPGEVTPMLVSAIGFEGWGAGEWDDFSFQKQHDAQVGRMAVVADRKWEDRAMLFTGKGLRALEIEFFTPDDLPRALLWLTAAAGSPITQ